MNKLDGQRMNGGKKLNARALWFETPHGVFTLSNNSANGANHSICFH